MFHNMGMDIGLDILLSIQSYNQLEKVIRGILCQGCQPVTQEQMQVLWEIVH
jgi:hypothetical protein